MALDKGKVIPFVYKGQQYEIGQTILGDAPVTPAGPDDVLVEMACAIVERAPVDGTPVDSFTARVINVGSNVKDLAIGDIVGCGHILSSCESANCKYCSIQEPQFCPGRVTLKQVSKDALRQYVVYKRQFVIKCTDAVDRECPVLFGDGLAVYCNMMDNNIRRGELKIGVYGKGPLMALVANCAKAMNPSNEVYLIGATEEEAQLLGHKKCGTKDDSMVRSLDYLYDTWGGIEAEYGGVCSFLKPRASMIIMKSGHTSAKFPYNLLLMQSNIVQGAGYGSPAKLGEAYDWIKRHNVKPQCEMISLPEAAMMKQATNLHKYQVVDLYAHRC